MFSQALNQTRSYKEQFDYETDLEERQLKYRLRSFFR